MPTNGFERQNGSRALSETRVYGELALELFAFLAGDRRQGVVGVPGDEQVIGFGSASLPGRAKFLLDCDIAVARRGYLG